MPNSLMAMLGASIEPLLAKFKQAKTAANHAGHEIGHGFSHHVTDAIAGIASVAFVEQAAHKTIEYAEKVTDLSRRLGMSTDAIQEWDYALRMNGSSIDSASGFFEKLAIARGKALAGNGDSIKAFKDLGVSVEDLKSKRIEDIGRQIAGAFESGDPQKLIGSLREVGGKGAGAMVAAFRDGLGELVDHAKAIGVVMDAEVVGKLKEAGDKAKTLGMQFTASIAPAIAWAVEELQGLWRGLNKFATLTVTSLYTGSTKAGNEAADELEAQYEAQDKAAEDHRKHVAHIEGEDLEETASKSKHDAEVRHAEKILELRKQLLKEQQQTDLGAMTTAEKLEELARRRADLLQKMRTESNEEDALKDAMEVERIDQQTQGLSKNKTKIGTPVKNSVNSLQQIGAYATGFDPHLKVQQDQLGELRQIKVGINKLQQRGSASGSDTEY